MARKVKALPGPAKTQGFVEIVEGVHIFIGGGGGTNFGLVLTDEKPVIVDNDIRGRKVFVSGMKEITRKSPGLVSQYPPQFRPHLRQRLLSQTRSRFRW